MSRLYKRQLTKLFYFLLICGCIYIILKFLLIITREEKEEISNFKNLQQSIVSMNIYILDKILSNLCVEKKY